MINWYKAIRELGLIAIAGIWINSIDVLTKEFNWYGLFASITGMALVIVLVIARNLESEVKK